MKTPDMKAWWGSSGRVMTIALGVLAVLAIETVVALWLAGFVFFALARHNPFLAGGFGYVDALTDWSHGLLDGYGKRLVIAGAIGGLVTYVGPLAVVGVLRAQSGKRELHGSARFANEREIRKAGLL
ncbi:hypothetical protein [Burkholderia pyrrocinia]|uniref:hypothetical protein n=1 Tax=Burkholderia pyrrocinia TaxID=60550 RepID=UPI001BCABF0A|nr:hypothetical protein [Burkholderia pyrrocinia]QVN18988.1 hypothetical protein JYG32_04425 [Burkholderia pyrrocinia]